MKLLNFGLIFLVISCSTQKETMQEDRETPEHQTVWRGLYVLDDGTIKEASDKDISTAKNYPSFDGKGEWKDETRLTILSEKSSYELNEEIRVIHVVESTKADYELYIMGPKTVYGETVNGELMSPALPELMDDPLIPLMYDGETVPCPTLDYNYEITSYSFDSPGEYKIQWELGDMISNELIITVK